MAIWWVLAGICAIIIAVWPFWIERRRRPVGRVERRNAKGEFAQLSQGVTHYRWVGSSRGPVAVMIHGLATPMISMETVAEGLGRMGYQVLMYDLYGRGLSDAPAGLQDRAFFLRQLSDLLEHQEIESEVTLAGYSMGGSIAVAFAAENPFAVKRLFLFAPTGVMHNETGFARFCRRVPGLGDWVHALFVYNRIKHAIPDHGETSDIDRVLRAQRRELQRRGYLPALLSSRRGMLTEVQAEAHRQLGRKGIPVVAIWAEADRIIPINAVGKLTEWNRNARQEIVEDADHGLPYTHGPRLIEALRQALRD